MNIQLINNGFIFNDIEYIFDENQTIDIINEEQIHIPTNHGIILFDLTCTINNDLFSDIDLFIKALKGE